MVTTKKPIWPYFPKTQTVPYCRYTKQVKVRQRATVPTTVWFSIKKITLHAQWPPILGHINYTPAQTATSSLAKPHTC